MFSLLHLVKNKNCKLLELQFYEWIHFSQFNSQIYLLLSYVFLYNCVHNISACLFINCALLFELILYSLLTVSFINWHTFKNFATHFLYNSAIVARLVVLNIGTLDMLFSALN